MQMEKRISKRTVQRDAISSNKFNPGRWTRSILVDIKRWYENHHRRYSEPYRISRSGMEKMFGGQSSFSNLRKGVKFKDIVSINVSGTIFETTWETLANGPSEFFANRSRMDPYWIENDSCYFFERRSDCFEEILSIIQKWPNCDLSLPSEISFEEFLDELAFFDMSPVIIQGFLVSQHMSFIDLDDFFEPKFQFKSYFWNLLEHPESSKLAYGIDILRKLVMSVMAGSALIGTIQIQSSGQASTSSIVVQIVCMMFSCFDCLGRMAFAPCFKKFISSSFNVIDVISIVTPLTMILTLILCRSLVFDSTLESTDVWALKLMFVCSVVQLYKFYKYNDFMKGLVITVRLEFVDMSVVLLLLIILSLLFAQLFLFFEARSQNVYTAALLQRQQQNLTMNYGNGSTSMFDNDTISIGHPNLTLFDAVWWSQVTMGTIGYGEIIPKAIVGKVVAICFIFSSRVLISMLVPIFYMPYRSNIDGIRHSRQLRRIIDSHD